MLCIYSIKLTGFQGWRIIRLWFLGETSIPEVEIESIIQDSSEETCDSDQTIDSDETFDPATEVQK